jgi:hypothetical protein
LAAAAAELAGDAAGQSGERREADSSLPLEAARPERDADGGSGELFALPDESLPPKSGWLSWHDFMTRGFCHRETWRARCLGL